MSIMIISHLINVCNNLKINGILWKSFDEIVLFVDEYYFTFDIFTNILSDGERIKNSWPEVRTPINGASFIEEERESQTTNTEKTYKYFFCKDFYYWMYNENYRENSTAFTLIANGILSFDQSVENGVYIGCSLVPIKKSKDSAEYEFQFIKNNEAYACLAFEKFGPNMTFEMHITENCTTFKKIYSKNILENATSFDIYFYALEEHAIHATKDELIFNSLVYYDYAEIAKIFGCEGNFFTIVILILIAMLAITLVVLISFWSYVYFLKTKGKNKIEAPNYQEALGKKIDQKHLSFDLKKKH
ncbi:hypothetical protein B4U79_18798 [Dinothrombium tinctorium]|uniref:Uncharacterized protein n=1 Tax=Dinothrombium tinctorium TaxID=1965070 RepID=A0A443Q8S1_9ACAR|nr:hypothetical protein B4U79_18798 [Dinothrombium tinctorium]